MSVSPSSASSFISFDTISKKVSWFTSDPNFVKSYTITITATINTATIQTGSTSFKLTVKADCAHESSIFTVNPSSATNQNYNVGSASGS